MKKIISVVMCAALMLTCLAACQSAPEVPYVTGEGVQVNSQPTQPNQGGQQSGQQGGQQDGQQTTTPPTQDSQQGDQQTTTPTTQPTQGGQQGGQNQTDPTEDENFVLPTPEECTLKQYESMTGEQQAAFFAQFSDGAAFFEWLVKAQAEDKANSGDIEVGSDSTIDIDNIFGNQ